MHNKPSRLAPFVFGLLLGILCTIYLPKYVRPYLPESMFTKEIALKGTVVMKEKKGDALLLTVSTPEGALLATIKQKTREVDLLINEKDKIEITLPNYMPFIDDPKIIRVVKEQQAVPAPPEAPVVPAGTEGKSMKERKSRHPVKPQTAALIPVSAKEVKPPDQADGVPPAVDTKTEQ
jgi:hypothetical protein